MALYEVHSLSGELPFHFYHLPITKNYVFVNWHSNLELFYCADGEGEVLCGSEPVKIKKGEIVIINANILHDIISNTYLDCYCLIIDNEFCRTNGIDPENIRFKEHITSPEAEDYFLRVRDAFESPEETRVPEMRYAVLGLMLYLFKHHREAIGQFINDSENARHIKEIITYIKLHFTEKLTLEGIAKEMGVCKSHLVHQFKRYSGQTVTQYINTLRCVNARSLIRNGVSITTAAFSSGFDNLSYFSRSYKKYMSVLPSEDKKI